MRHIAPHMQFHSEGKNVTVRGYLFEELSTVCQASAIYDYRKLWTKRKTLETRDIIKKFLRLEMRFNFEGVVIPTNRVPVVKVKRQVQLMYQSCGCSA